jgi:hypothetical protein
MRVGIYTHYAHCDQAYLCIRLVEFLRQRGVEFSIYSDNSPGKLGLAYDSAVTYRGQVKFTDWVQKQNAVIWTQVPKYEQLSYVSNRNKLTILAPMWQELLPPFKKTMRRADYVVSLAAECQELFRDVYNLRNAVYVPFDPGLPLTRKDTPVDARQIRVLLPWFDRNARCASSEFLGGLAYLYERMPDSTLTVGITSSKFSPAIAKFFAALGRRTEQRVKLVRNVSFSRRTSIYSDYDVTLLTGECDNFGAAGLTSINCGTPILSFAVSPQVDYVHQNENGILVRTKTDYDENGVPHAIPDYELLLETLQTMIAEPWHLDRLNKRVTYNLAARRKAFEAGWQAMLGLA